MTYDTECKIRDMKTKKYREQDGICAGCGQAFKEGDIKELSHIIPQRLWLRRKYGDDVIYHPLNMKLTHTGDCNPAVQISPNKTGIVNYLIEQIRRELDEKDY
ncbi:MAG: hypothetical protein JRJ00_00340 [Deltaproteobacteria bacterium]|nr:hypothetical protein [Deltaproteobacteria bacterium]